MVHFIDRSLCLIAFAFPAIAVLRWNARGIWIGAIGQWAALVAAGQVLRALDPASRSGFTSVADGAWLVFGWLFSLAYAAGLRPPRLLPPGLCPACGYDVRATPGRCPECGA
jgi:hypothetical protein